MSALPAHRRVHVAHHAVRRLHERRGDHRSQDEIREAIEQDVREAFAAGRVANHKPKWAGLFGRTCRISPGSRCVWNEEETLAWVVVREDTLDTVVTTLTRTGGARI